MLQGRPPPAIAAVVVAIAGCATLPQGAPAWPQVGPAESTTSVAASETDAARIQKLPVCVASRNWAAGDLGETILYRLHRVGNRLEVGYFVYWSTERPWGQNML